jgi:hypothetical protein
MTSMAIQVNLQSFYQTNHIMRKLLCAIMLFSAIKTYGQGPNHQQPLNFTSDQDKKNMMEQLGIKTMRPGPSGDEKAPNHANNDEALANPYPNWPDVLTMKNGKKVTSADMWWKQRRPEIVEDFEREMYGPKCAQGSMECCNDGQ